MKTPTKKGVPPGNTAGERRCATCGKADTLYYHNGKSMCQTCIVDFAHATLDIYNEGRQRAIDGDYQERTYKQAREGYVVTSMDMDFLFTQVKEMKNALDKLARQITGINLSHGDLAREVHENTEVLKDLIEELSE